MKKLLAVVFTVMIVASVPVAASASASPSGWGGLPSVDYSLQMRIIAIFIVNEGDHALVFLLSLLLNKPKFFQCVIRHFSHTTSNLSVCSFTF